MPQHLEKREDGVRIDHGLEVRITAKSDLANAADGVGMDIGLGGIKIICDRPFPRRDEVVIGIKLSSELTGLIAEAKVMRVEPIFFEHAIKYSIAFRFSKLAPEAKKKLKSHLRESIYRIRNSINQ